MCITIYYVNLFTCNNNYKVDPRYALKEKVKPCRQKGSSINSTPSAALRISTVCLHSTPNASILTEAQEPNLNHRKNVLVIKHALKDFTTRSRETGQPLQDTLRWHSLPITLLFIQGLTPYTSKYTMISEKWIPGFPQWFTSKMHVEWNTIFTK